jgi:hypothetical protein
MPTLSTNNLLAGLTKAATVFTTAMFARTRGDDYPHTKKDHDRMIYSIQDSTRIGAATPTDKGAYIDIIINLKKAPYAHAYEFGAGEYPIEPKPNGPGKLIFPRADWPQYKPPPNVNIFKFSSVTHHGIKAHPFLKPTLDEKRQEITALIGQEFRESYIRSMGKKVTVIK